MIKEFLTIGSEVSWMKLAGLLMVYILVPGTITQALVHLAIQHYGPLSKRRVYQAEFHAGQLWSEWKTSALTVLVDISVFATALKLYWPYLNPQNTLATFIFGAVWFELAFYFSHRAMHTKRFWWIHKHHHESKVTSPFTSTTFGALERLWLWGVTAVGYAAFAMFVPLSFNGVVLFLLLNYSYNVVLHSNVEFLPPWISQSKLLFWVGFPYYHSMHHARVSANFGGGVRIYDMIFGTEFSDHREVQRRAWEGKGLTRLMEKGRIEKPAVAPHDPELLNQVASLEIALTQVAPKAGPFHASYIYEVPYIKTWLEVELNGLAFATPVELSTRLSSLSENWYFKRAESVFGPMNFAALCNLESRGLMREKDLCFSLAGKVKTYPSDLPASNILPISQRKIHVNRREPRAQFQCAIALRDEAGTVRALTVDVGRTGAAIFVKTPLTAGGAYRAEFTNLVDAQSFETDIEIVNVKSYGEGYRCGVVFKNLERKRAAHWVSLMEKNRVFA